MGEQVAAGIHWGIKAKACGEQLPCKQGVIEFESICHPRLEINTVLML